MITVRALYGTGGVGKTITAIEYGHAHAADYTATLFVTGRWASELRDSLAALADAAVLDLPEKSLPELDARVEAVIRWLRANPGWLLIIDSVDNETAAGAVRAFLDQISHSDGHVLITSRLSKWDGVVQPLALGLLSSDVAKDLLRDWTPHRTQRTDDDAALTRLVNEYLGPLPIALVVAASYIDHWKISFAEYFELMEEEDAASIAAELDQPLPHAIGLRFDETNCLRYDPTANADALTRDQDAVDRHAECLRLARKWRHRCHADIGGNSAAELIEECDLFVTALGDSIDSMRPMLVVMRFVTLEQLLKSQDNRDVSSDVVALPDQPLSDLRALVKNAGIFIALDGELDATYRADPGSDSFAQISPAVALRLVNTANEAGLTDNQVRVIVEVEVKQAQSPNADPATAQRLSRDTGHIVRRLLGRIMATGKAAVKNAKNIETIGGWVKGAWRWVTHHQSDLIAMFPERPEIIAAIREIIRSLSK